MARHGLLSAAVHLCNPVRHLVHRMCFFTVCLVDSQCASVVEFGSMFVSGCLPKFPANLLIWTQLRNIVWVCVGKLGAYSKTC